MSERERNGWTPAAVGCHWSRGDYHASTITCGDRSGYVLSRNREQIAEFITWEEVERLADRRCKHARPSGI